MSLRNIRQDTNNSIKKEDYPEDEEDRMLDVVQKLIDKYNKIVDEKAKEKEAELMQI